MSDGENSDVPEMETLPHIQPYQFEPVVVKSNAEQRYTSSESESEESGLEEESDHHQQASRNVRRDNDSWCDCGCCRTMPSELECLCCQEIDIVVSKTEESGISCISKHDGFIANCLNRDVLEVSVFEFVDHQGPIGDNEPAHKLYRHIAYRRFTRWIWHRLGKSRRKVLPACVVTAIRQTFPSQEYCGFKYVLP